MSKKRILIVSDAYSRKTGYSRVSSSIMYNLNKHYTIGHLGVSDVPLENNFNSPMHYYTVLKNHGKCCGKGDIIEYRPKDTKDVKYLIPTLSVPEHKDQNFCPRATNMETDLYGQDSSFFVIQHFKPDIVIPINDIWGLYHYNYLLNRKHFVFMPYLAIDSECFPLQISPQKPSMPVIDTLQFVKGTNKVVVFTDFAKDTLDEAITLATGSGKANNIEIISHGVDRNLFKPLDNKEELREKYFHITPESDIFLIGCLGRNQIRKGFDLLIMAMRIFIDKYEKPGRKLMCHFHCAMKDRMGWDLVHLAKYYNVLDRCIFDNKLVPGFGVPEPVLNEIINTYDSHIMLSTSEGFCSFGDTSILTPEGIKNLDEFKNGDLVWTHTGNIEKVLKPLSREYSGRMCGFKYRGSSRTVWFTPNHRLLVANNLLEKDWIPASMINKNHYLCLPKPKVQKYEPIINTKDIIEKYSDYKVTDHNGSLYGIKTLLNGLTKHNTKSKPFPTILNIDEFDCEFFGNYIAEGSGGQGDIKISINSTADDIIRSNTKRFASKFNFKCSSYIMERNRENVSIVSTTIGAFFKCFRQKAHRKKIPIELFNILCGNPNLCKSFLNGVFEGDGYCSEKNGAVYTTVSETLAYQIKFLFLTLGIYSNIYCTIRKVHRDSFVVQISDPINFRKCKEFIDRCACIEYNRKITNRFFKEDEKYFYIPIRSLHTKEYSGKVYNLSVEKDESYITDGFAVHNCLPILETMSAGIPNIISNFSAHGSWTKDSALKVKVAAKFHEVRTNHRRALCDVEHAAKQISLLYNSPKLCRDYSRRSIDIAEELQWSTVCEDWKTLIDSIEIPDSNPDRYDALVINKNSIPEFPNDPISTEFNLLEI